MRQVVEFHKQDCFYAEKTHAAKSEIVITKWLTDLEIRTLQLQKSNSANKPHIHSEDQISYSSGLGIGIIFSLLMCVTNKMLISER